MSRYTKELAIIKTPEQVGEITSQFLMNLGFTLKDYADGEKVWQKGDGWVTSPQFVRVMTRPGFVKVEAWIKFALLPGVFLDEMDLNGFFGWAVKKMLKERVVVLEHQLGA